MLIAVVYDTCYTDVKVYVGNKEHLGGCIQYETEEISIPWIIAMVVLLAVLLLLLIVAVIFCLCKLCAEDKQTTKDTDSDFEFTPAITRQRPDVMTPFER